MTELSLVRNERPTLPPDAACEVTLCPGLEALAADLGVMRREVERIRDRPLVVEANQKIQIQAQRETNTMLASLLERTSR